MFQTELNSKGDNFKFDTKSAASSIKAVENNSCFFYDSEENVSDDYCDDADGNREKKRSLVVEVTYKGFELTDEEKDFVKVNLTEAIKKVLEKKQSEVSVIHT